MNKNILSTNRAIGKGLYYLFMAQLLGLFSSLTMLGTVLSVLSAGVAIYALYTMSKAEPAYRIAFALTIANVAVAAVQSYSLLGNLPAMLVSLLPIAVYAINIIMVYKVCTVTGNLLTRLNPSLKERSAMIWKLYGICYLFIIARTLLNAAGAPENFFTTQTTSFIAGFASILASLWYLVFIWQSQDTLQKH